MFHFSQRKYKCNCCRNTVYNVIASPHVVHHRVGRKERMSSLCPLHLRGLRTISLGIETEQLTFDRLIDYRWSTFDFSKIHYRQSIFKFFFKKSTIDNRLLILYSRPLNVDFSCWRFSSLGIRILPPKIYQLIDYGLEKPNRRQSTFDFF